MRPVTKAQTFRVMVKVYTEPNNFKAVDYLVHPATPDPSTITNEFTRMKTKEFGAHIAELIKYGVLYSIQNTDT